MKLCPTTPIYNLDFTIYHSPFSLPATGLTHLGGGRYYAPSLGRPLQPNSQGGVPLVPQALNRYAATSLGQVGVAEGEANNFLANTTLTAVSNTPGAVVASLAERTFRYYPILKGNKTNLLKAIRNADITNQLGDDVVSVIKRDLRGKTIKQLGVKAGHIFEYESGNFVSQIDSPASLKVGTATLYWQKGQPSWRNFIHANGLLIGVGIDVGVSALFEIGAPYWSNPYLSGGQKVGQLGSNLFFVGVASGGTFYTVAFIGVTGPAGVIATIGIATIYGLFANNASQAFIEAVGFNQENRNLKPLGGTP